jgi:sirohydrochlorin ferrochelatase
LIIFAHGSRVVEANEAVRRVAGAAAARCGISLWETAFLELASPDLAEAVRSLVQQGVRRIVVAPYFLTMGIHLQRDLPQLLAEVAAQQPGIELLSSPPLDGHPGLAEILADRARETLQS